MLVRDPSKRYTIKMVRKHVWMQADVKAAQSAKNYTKPTTKAPTVINRTVVDPKSTEEEIAADRMNILMSEEISFDDEGHEATNEIGMSLEEFIEHGFDVDSD